MFNEDSRIHQEIRRLSRQLKKQPALFARLGDYHLRLGDADHAEAILRTGIEDFPDYPNAYLVLAEILLYKGFYRDAEECALNGLQRDPNHLGLLHLLMRIKKKKENDWEVTQLQATLVKLDPLHEHEFSLPAGSEVDSKAAESLSGDASVPSPAETWKLRAAARIKKEAEAEEASEAGLPGQFEPTQTQTKSAAVGEESREIPVPDTSQAMPPAAEAENLQSYLNEIIASSEALAEEASDISELDQEPASAGGRIATRTLGELYAQQGKFEEAIEIYQRLVENDPESESYRNRLEELRTLLETAASKHKDYQDG